MLYTKSRSLQDCHSGSRTATTVPVHIAEISLDITKSSSLGVRQSDLSYKTVTTFTVDYRMWDRIYKNPVWFHIHLWSEFMTWDFEFLQAWYSYCTWCSILSLYFSRTMLKYDQNVLLNKVICTEATNTLGGSVTSRIQSILIDSGVYEPPRREDRLYSWMGHHTVYYITQLSTILIDKQLLLLLHPTWQVSAGSLGV